MTGAEPAVPGVPTMMTMTEAGPPARNVQATSAVLETPFHEEAPELRAEPITQPEALPRTRRWSRRVVAGERWIARVLRTGAVMSGGMFVASLALEALPRDESVHVAIDLLRKGAASMLLVTPVARLAMAGTLLGLRGEWKYAAIAAGVMGLLALAVGAGFQA
jgi:hypothetical protein